MALVYKHTLLPLLMAAGLSANPSAAADSISIVGNQVGYLPHWPKLAMQIGGDPKAEGGEFTVIAADSREPVLTAAILPALVDPQSGDVLRILDFSTLHKPGKYILKSGTSESHAFTLAETAYDAALKLMLRSFYLQRCGLAIDDLQSQVKHAACHTRDALLAHTDEAHKAGEFLPATGGWHDAGDYGKYIATAAVTVGRILSAYERHPQLFTDMQLAIPESQNNVPDVLDEMQYELDWMLTMQRQDGAVYRKLGGKAWPHALPPDTDTQERYIYGISTPDTAKAAAAWAMAARIYKNTVPERAEKYLQAAEKAWAYLETQPKQVFEYTDGDNSGSGPYMLNKTDTDPALSEDWDDRLWAAMELNISNPRSEYLNYVKARLAATPLHLFEWKNPSALALEEYLFNPAADDNLEIAASIKQKFIDRAEFILENTGYSGYHIANARFTWSSNKMTAEEGLVLLAAYQLKPDPRYLKAAIGQLDYLLGRNHFDLAFVSGLGVHSVSHVSHIFATQAKILIPGLLVGGPNALEQSGIAAKFKGPLSYIDDNRSYGTNEYAIDYNASMIGFIAEAISVGSQ